MCASNHLHEFSFNRIGRYFKETTKKGLALSPTLLVFIIYCFPDADFSGMYVHKNTTNISCVKIRTGCVNTCSDFPMLCKSKL